MGPSFVCEWVFWSTCNSSFVAMKVFFNKNNKKGQAPMGAGEADFDALCLFDKSRLPSIVGGGPVGVMIEKGSVTGASQIEPAKKNISFESSRETTWRCYTPVLSSHLFGRPVLGSSLQQAHIKVHDSLAHIVGGYSIHNPFSARMDRDLGWLQNGRCQMRLSQMPFAQA